MKEEKQETNSKLFTGLSAVVVLVLAVVFIMIRAQQAAREPDVTDSPLATPSWTPVSPIATPTWTPEPTITPVPTEDPQETPLPLPTNMPQPTETPLPTVEPEPTEAPLPSPTPYEYVVQPGDWLSKIALRHTGNALDWPQIVAVHDAAAEEIANQHLRRNIHRNPDLIFAYEVLRLPQEWAGE